MTTLTFAPSPAVTAKSPHPPLTQSPPPQHPTRATARRLPRHSPPAMALATGRPRAGPHRASIAERASSRGQHRRVDPAAVAFLVQYEEFLRQEREGRDALLGVEVYLHPSGGLACPLVPRGAAAPPPVQGFNGIRPAAVAGGGARLGQATATPTLGDEARRALEQYEQYLNSLSAPERSQLRMDGVYFGANGLYCSL